MNLTYYNRLTSDKYADFSLTPTSGFSSIKNNNGEFRNQGIELEVSAKLLETKDWSWSAALNAGINKNTVVRLPDNGNKRNRKCYPRLYWRFSHG